MKTWTALAFAAALISISTQWPRHDRARRLIKWRCQALYPPQPSPDFTPFRRGEEIICKVRTAVAVIVEEKPICAGAADFDFRNLTGNQSLAIFMRRPASQGGEFVWQSVGSLQPAVKIAAFRCGGIFVPCGAGQPGLCPDRFILVRFA